MPSCALGVHCVQADPWLNEGFKQKLGDPSAAAVNMNPEQHEYVLSKMEQLGIARDAVEQSLSSKGTVLRA